MLIGFKSGKTFSVIDQNKYYKANACFSKSFTHPTITISYSRKFATDTEVKTTTNKITIPQPQRDLLSKKAHYLFNQGESLASENKFQEAEVPLLSCMQAAKILQDNSLGGKTAGILGYSYSQRESLTSAETYLKESISLLQNDKNETTFTALMYSYLAEVFSKSTKLSEASTACKKGLEIITSSKNANATLVAGMKSNLAGYLLAEEKYVDAEPLVKDAFSYFNNAMGKQDPLTRKSASNLLKILKAQGKDNEIKELQDTWKNETEQRAKLLEETAKQQFAKDNWWNMIEQEWKDKELKRFDPPGLFLPQELKQKEFDNFQKLWNKNNSAGL